MRKVIVTDLTRFSSPERLCTAAIDIETGECFRPMPYLTSQRCKELNLLPGAILEGELSITESVSRPHVEDAHYNKLSFQGPCTSEEFRGVLENTLSGNVSSGFGVDLEVDPIPDTVNQLL